MSRAASAALVLAALAGAAAAETTAPPGWKYDEGISLEQTRKAQQGSQFGGTPTTKVAVEAFLAPAGGSLFVTRAEATPPADIRDGVATRALFILLQSAARAGGADIETAAQSANAANKSLESTIAWRDAAGGIREHGRTVVVADAQHLVAITGECLLPLDVTKDVEQACTAALAALDPGIAVDQRIALKQIGAPAETYVAPATPSDDATAGTPQPPSSRMSEPSRLDGTRTPMAPMTISPAKRERDRRPLYLGGGIIVLAVLFYWNRRRRDRFDREDGVKPATTESGPEPTSGDADADDLHAAARGEAPKDEP